jgi:hypothetical protein
MIQAKTAQSFLLKLGHDLCYEQVFTGAISSYLLAASQPVNRRLVIEIWSLVITPTIQHPVLFPKCAQLKTIFALSQLRKRMSNHTLQSVALSTICALASLLILGVFAELYYGNGSFAGRRPVGSTESESAVPDHVLPIAWLILSVAFLVLDRVNQPRTRTRHA